MSKQSMKYSILKIHISSVHEGQKEFKCDMCEKCFATNHYLKEHQKLCVYHEVKITLSSDSSKSQFLCSICSKIFARAEKLRTHIKENHVTNKMAACDVCCKEFRSKSRLNHHRRTVHDRETKEPLVFARENDFNPMGYLCTGLSKRIATLMVNSPHMDLQHILTRGC